MPSMEIDKLFDDSSLPKVKEELERENIFVKDKEEQKRINLNHYVIHFLAVFIIVSYIFFIIWNVKLPQEFSTIVSIIIGFYFAKSLFNSQNK
jgi:hypothetical protein